MGDKEPIGDDALVVRGGKVTGEHMRNGCREYQGVYGFSVQCASGRTVAELARAGEIPHASLGVSMVGKLRAAGYEVVRTGKGLHATVVVPRPWTEEAATALATLFHGERNPTPRS